jgi:glycosyltransferase involved in cell wall biosynthesis
VWIFNHYAGTPSVTNGLRHYNFAKNLIKAGYPTTVFASSAIHNSNKNLIVGEETHITDDSEGVPFTYIRTRNYQDNGKSRILNMIDYYKGLLKVTKYFDKPDIIIASSVHPLTLVAGIKIANKLGVPCICEIRDLWPESFLAYDIMKKSNLTVKLLYAGEKWIYKKADKLIFTMEGGKEYIIDKGWEKSVDLNKVHHINNGVDLEVFNCNRDKYILDDADLNDSGTFKVIYTGSIRRVNKVGLLLDAALILMKKGNEKIKFLIYGNGDELDSLQQRVIDENLSNVMFKGRIEKKYIPYINSMGQLNIVLGESLPLFKYGVSMNKLFDYFASEKPTLSTFKTGYSILDKYKSGIEIEDNSAEKIADSILHFYNMDRDRYKEYCNNALRAAHDYSSEMLTGRLIGIINSTSICLKNKYKGDD